MVAAAAQRRVSVRHEDRWPVYLVNGNEAPDARPLLVPLLEAGRLVVADPDAAESLILPA
ncbi:hypothetical protein [Actinoplanes sp. NPDC051494]|uniref:hypothetical protein n=1 Tax=Actinoplanes sp. NPDC051494 TaxID=3363907 RepID=UPI00378EFE0D